MTCRLRSFFGADERREVGGTSRHGGGVCCRIDDARLAGLLAIPLSLSLLGISFFFASDVVSCSSHNKFVIGIMPRHVDVYSRKIKTDRVLKH